MKVILSTALVLVASVAVAATATKTTTTKTTKTEGAVSVAPSTTTDKTTTTTTVNPNHATAGTNEGFNLIHVADLEAMKKSSNVYIYDANNDKTRKADGMIPGAKPLASSSGYDVAHTLPADKQAHVVFYCANTMCMASHDAAKRAVAAGYKNVSVMADGIQGWKKSGQPTEIYK